MSACTRVIVVVGRRGLVGGVVEDYLEVDEIENYIFNLKNSSIIFLIPYF